MSYSSKSTGPKPYRIDRDLVTSKAWLSLGGKAPQVYILFLARRKTVPDGKKKFRYANLDHIEFTYNEALEIGLSQDMFRTAIDSLVKAGFIDIMKYGGGVKKAPTIYGLSNRWRRFGESDFAEAERRKCKRGYCNRINLKQNKSTMVTSVITVEKPTSDE